MGMLMMLEISFALDKGELFLMIKGWFCATDLAKQTQSRLLYHHQRQQHFILMLGCANPFR